ncbi:hypothetical protein D3C73_758890 [compost metagenome]
MPEQLLVNARVSNDLYANSEQAAANLSVPIALHKESLAKTGDTPQINKSLTIAGQSYDIHTVKRAGLFIYCDSFILPDYSPANASQKALP